MRHGDERERTEHPVGGCGGHGVVARQAQLEVKAESRDIIGRAKGILVARSDDVTDDQALAMLKSASSRTNVRLIGVARRIADHQAPEAAPSRGGSHENNAPSFTPRRWSR